MCATHFVEVAELMMEKAREIRALATTATMAHADLDVRYGVTAQTIGAVLKGQNVALIGTSSGTVEGYAIVSSIIPRRVRAARCVRG